MKIPARCPLRGARVPLGLCLLAAVLLVVASLLVQSLHGDYTAPPPEGDASPPAAATTPHGLLTLPTPIAPGGATASPAATPSAPAPPPFSTGALATVVRVVDGDTARVRVGDTEVTLRLIGLDTPETVHPTQKVECWGPEASAEAKTRLPVGASVRLHTDPTQGALDRYGRALVYLELPGGLDYAEHMIAGGFGAEYTYSRKYERQETYRKAQAHAKETRAGLWGACT